MDAPLVSIVIPCYNVKKYLRDAVESAVHQTYKNIEIILVDDGSVDGTTQLCDSFAEENENVRVVHKENGGLSSARNVGMSETKGEYLYFLDSDDFIDEVAIDNLVKRMQEFDLDVAFFGSVDVNESGKRINNLEKMTCQDNCVYTGLEAYTNFLSRDVYAACVPYYFYKKSFIDEHSISFLEGILHEDELFSFMVYRFAKRLMVDQRVFYYRRIREGSIMTSTSNILKKFESTVWITSYITNKQAVRTMGIGEKKIWLLFLRRIQDLMCARYSEMNWAQRKTVGKEYRGCLKKYIYPALVNERFSYTQLAIKRYILSFYALLKKDNYTSI